MGSPFRPELTPFLVHSVIRSHQRASNWECPVQLLEIRAQATPEGASAAMRKRKRTSRTQNAPNSPQKRLCTLKKNTEDAKMVVLEET